MQRGREAENKERVCLMMLSPAETNRKEERSRRGGAVRLLADHVECPGFCCQRKLVNRGRTGLLGRVEGEAFRFGKMQDVLVLRVGKLSM